MMIIDLTMENKKKLKNDQQKNKMKNKQEIKRICYGVLPMSAKFNVFS